MFGRPWLDGPTALAATIGAAPAMTIATTVALPVVRGPAPTSKMLAALHRLSGGRLVAGLGPASSRDDYAAVGAPFDERWKRFDGAVGEVRSLLGADSPPIWLASRGSPAGMRACDHETSPELTCSHCHERLSPGSVRAIPGPGGDERQRAEGMLAAAPGATASTPQS